MNKWTEEEIKILKEKYPIHGSNINELNRSKNAIGIKASKENIRKKSKLLYKLNETEKAYIAGIVDSEGSVGFHIREHQYEKLCLEPIIAIVNKNKEFLKNIKDIIKSNCYFKTDKNGVSQLVFVGNDKVYSLLKNIQNFLIVKRKQCNNLLEFFDLHEKGKYTEYEYLLAKKIYKLNNGYGSDKAVEKINKAIKNLENGDNND